MGAFCSPSGTGNFAAQVCEHSRTMQMGSAGAAGGCQLEHLTESMHSDASSHRDGEVGCKHPIAVNLCVSRTASSQCLLGK